MTLNEFEGQIFSAVMASSICNIPIVRRLTPTSISIRVEVTTGGFIDVFYNEETGTTSFALIRQDKRVFGADNTGGWHIHPFTDPGRHEPISGAISFTQFLAKIEQFYS